jgi:hypothetical protein
MEFCAEEKFQVELKIVNKSGICEAVKRQIYIIMIRIPVPFVLADICITVYSL